MLEYTLADYDPATDGDEVEWAKRLDAQGWRTWHDTGVWLDVNGRRVKRWSLRRRPPGKTPAAPPGSEAAGSVVP